VAEMKNEKREREREGGRLERWGVGNVRLG